MFRCGTRRQARPKASEDEEKGAQPATAVDEKALRSPTSPTIPTSPTSPSTAKPVAHTDGLTWKNLEYTGPTHGEDDRTLLNDVSGCVAPGKLTALMGESGAGKTTLRNALAKKVYSGTVRGDMFVNGQVLPADFQAQTGYVQQMDTHLPFSTVREALLFSDKLRYPPMVSLEEKEA
ncbi:hypothetical protein DFP72DRAFT_970517 [Ephemerocybe angulata]|uniref:ABC transporter domain-containing protein n=1 Tax=Ephemerocybe angulata TaxID=980116 RepID=A0A8H6HMN2_9AGAR|nr:hypothetical protein DFP72DRAFT_970517 [Tulosesus angulatus]